jgi:ketosteroid isomerase-like protein
MSYTRPFSTTGNVVNGVAQGDSPWQCSSLRRRVMKRLLLCGLMVLLTAGVATAQQKSGKSGDDASGDVAKALIDLENQWVKASKAADGDALAPILAATFVSLDSDGSLHPKSEYIARTKKSKWTTNEIADMKVTVHGNSAIVTGTWTGKGTDGTGKAVDAKERWVDTWVKMSDGKWQCVASASAAIK